MTDKIVVLQLRASSGSGGGPEKTIYNTGRYIDPNRFLYLIAYLKKNESDLSPIAQMIKNTDLNYFEFSGTRFVDLTQLWNIIKLIKKYKVQILHCHDPKTDFYGILLKIMFPKLKFVSTIHGWIQKTWKSIFYNKLDIWALRLFKRVIAVSKDLEQKAKRCCIKRTCVIYNAIDINEWQPIYSTDPDFLVINTPESFVVGYIGRISKEKGPIDFVRVAHKVLQYDNLFEFVVAGEGPQMELMKTLAIEFGIIQHFHFLGQVKSTNIFKLYQKLDLLLSTSYTEGLPNNILEACAMYVPVVATRVGGVGEIIDDGYNGFLADPGDINALAELILRIKNDKKLADRLKNNSRITIEEKFSFDVRVKNIEELYRGIVQ